MAEGKASNELVLVFIGKKDRKDKAGVVVQKSVYSLMKKATATKIGVQASRIKSNVTETVKITKGAGKGASYKRPVKGSRGIQWKFYYAGTSGAGTTKKNTESVSVGFPTGTSAEVVIAFAATLPNKPLKVVSPSGVTHHLEG
jgi:hypothetical protein